MTVGFKTFFVVVVLDPIAAANVLNQTQDTCITCCTKHIRKGCNVNWMAQR